MEDIKRRLIDYLSTDFGSEPDISESLSEQYDLDSLSILDLYLQIENIFNIEIPEQDRKMDVKFDELFSLIKSKL
jgi:acyl carrier protein